jgi:hypothetical protein
MKAGRQQLFSRDDLLAGSIWAAVVLSVGNVVAQLIDYRVLDLRYEFLNSNTHASIFGVVSLLACAMAVAASFAVARKAGRLEALALPLALAVLLVLRVGRPPHFLVLAIPFTAIALVMLWREGSREERTIIRAGCGLLVLSFAIHALEGPASLDARTAQYQVWYLVKHDAELSGWILVAGGLASFARRSSRARLGKPLPLALEPPGDVPGS